MTEVIFQIFYVQQITECPTGLTLPEACGEALRSAIRVTWQGSKLKVPPGMYALVTPIVLDKDIILEGISSSETVVYNCIPMRCELWNSALSTCRIDPSLSRHCFQVRGESHESTVSIIGMTLQQRRSSETIDFADVYMVSGVCLDVRRGRCCSRAEIAQIIQAIELMPMLASRLFLTKSELYSECKECSRAVGGAAFLELVDCGVKCASDHAGVCARCYPLVRLRLRRG